MEKLEVSSSQLPMLEACSWSEMHPKQKLARGVLLPLRGTCAHFVAAGSCAAPFQVGAEAYVVSFDVGRSPRPNVDFDHHPHEVLQLV